MISDSHDLTTGPTAAQDEIIGDSGHAPEIHNNNVKGFFSLGGLNKKIQ
jgi:hypothetical protein